MKLNHLIILVCLFAFTTSHAQRRKMVTYRPMSTKLKVHSIDISAGIGSDVKALNTAVYFNRASAKKRPRLNGIKAKYYDIKDLKSVQLGYSLQYQLYRPTDSFIFLFGLDALAGYNYNKINNNYSSLFMGLTSGQLIKLNPRLPQPVYFKAGVEENIFQISGYDFHFNMNFAFGVEFIF
jgi:hypothetical protein